MRLSQSWFITVLVFLLGCTTPNRIFREQPLPSGKIVKVTSFNLVWGAEHDDRTPAQDCLALEFVTSVPNADPQLRDQEALEVFELIRPVSEQWGFDKAELYRFQSTRREGVYDIYLFKRSSDGKWSFTRHPAKVHIND